MERRYLIATLAIVVTIAGFSSGFQSLKQLSQRHDQRGQATAGPQCSRVPSIVSRLLASIKGEFRPDDPEEAQLLAEMNLPIAALQARAAEEAARQSELAAEVARQTATREAERARREAMKMHEQMAHANLPMPSVHVDLSGLDNLDQRINIRTAEIAERVAAQNMRIQIAAARMQTAAMQVGNSGKRHSPCSVRRGEMQ